MSFFVRIVGIALLGLGLAAAAQADSHSSGGTWTKKNFSINGTWSIVTTDGGQFLELDEKFKTRNAPDLKLFLSPLPASQVSSTNAVDGSVLISALKKNKGAQRYPLPAGIDLDDYESLVLHCEQFSKLWGVSEL